MTKRFRNYAISVAIAVVFVVLYLWYTNAFHADSAALLMKHLSDAFLVPGCVYLGICVIHVVSLWGTLDMLSYSFKQLASLFGRRKKDSAPESRKDAYFNYVQSRQGRNFSLWHLLFPGLLCLLLAILCTVAYFSV